MRFKVRAPGHWWAPGGWTILSDPTGPVDRPWKLLRHGSLIEWCHTLKIAKLAACRIVTAENRGVTP